MPLALASVRVKEIRRHARIAQRYMDVYAKGLIGRAAEYAVRKHRSYRRVPSSISMDISTITSGMSILAALLTKIF